MHASAIAPFRSVVISANVATASAGPCPFETARPRATLWAGRTKDQRTTDFTRTSTPNRRPRRGEAGAGHRHPRHAAGVRVHRLLRHLLRPELAADACDRRRGPAWPQARRRPGPPARGRRRARGRLDRRRLPRRRPPRVHARDARLLRARGALGRRAFGRARDGELTDPVAAARAVIDSNSYLTLGTADESGRPWVSPVWFAHSGYRVFFWVSVPEAQHSRNLETRPEVSIVIFDSQVAPSDAAAVYMTATAERLSGDELESGIEVFSRKSLAGGLPAYRREDVEEPAALRLYRAVATEHFALGEGSRRIPVDPS